MADALEFYDGGAFADCFFVQYPGGLGLKPVAHQSIKVVPRHSATVAFTGEGVAPASTTSTALTLAATSAAKKSPAGVDHLREAAETAERTRQALDVTLKSAASASSAVPGLVNKRGKLTNVLDKDDADAVAAQESEFDGSQIALHRIERKNNIGKNVAANVRDLVIAVPSGGGEGETAGSSTAPIVRSPTKIRKLATSSFSAASGGALTTTATAASSEGTVPDDMFASGNGKDVVVPFCTSNWRNKKNLLVPLAVRVAQHEQSMGDPTEGNLGDAIIDLATTMQEASREVEAEMEAKARAREEEDERRQAALEAEEAERAKQLLQQNAERQQANFQRRESREQRLERIRLERELRELEKKEKQRQRLLEKAAARLQISVEALEADEALLRTVETASTTASTVGRSAVSGVKLERANDSSNDLLGGYAGGSSRGNGAEDDEDEYATTRLQRGGLKSSVLDVPVISNEGILREMAALQKADEDAAALKALQQQQPQHAGAKTTRGGTTIDDGIHLRRGSDSDAGDGSDDDVDGLEVGALLNKKRRRL